MTEVESGYSDFINCERTGRRNAVPDIAEETTTISTTELTAEMGQLDIQGKEGVDASGDKGEKPEEQGGIADS